ncbi:MAG: AraC family transcriptional regulator [Eubacteriales bacterium]|nr:AraC family transcriptional regulator [Eubacteriales bacterium]
MYSYYKTSSLWQESYTKQVEASLKTSAGLLSDSLYSFYYLPKVMNVSDDYHTLSYLREVNSPEHSRFLSFSINSLYDQLEYFEPASEIIINMRLSDICISPFSFYLNSESCFPNYTYSKLDIVKLIKEKEPHNHSLEMFPCDTVSIRNNTAKEYFTVVLKESSYTFTYVLLINKEKLLGYFQLDSLPENVTFKLYKNNGTLLDEYLNIDSSHKNYNSKSENFVTIKADIPVVGATAEIGIPESFFKNVTKEAQQNVYTVIVISILIGLLISIIFSKLNVQPVQNLIKAQDIPEEKRSNNELVTIYNYLSESKAHNKAMNERILSNLMIKAFSGIPLTDEEHEYMRTHTEVFSRETRTAVARFRNVHDESEYQSMMLFEFRDKMPESFVIEPLNRQEFGIIMPADEESVFALKRYIVEINKQLQDKCRIICGVSAAFNGTHGMADAIKQALFSLPEDENDFAIFSKDTSIINQSRNKPDFRDFQAALFSWNIKEIDTLLVEFADAVIKENATTAQETFYTLLTFIKDAADAVNVPQEFFDECRYARSISGDANIRAFKVLVEYLFEKKATIQTDEKLLRNKEIVSYVNTHFEDPLLSASVLADMHSLSEKTINTILNDETGMSFANYLTSVRMQKAGEMLRDTNLEAVEIAEKCGLSISTFYRNFKKAYKMTPVQYKAQFTEKTPR